MHPADSSPNPNPSPTNQSGRRLEAVEAMHCCSSFGILGFGVWVFRFELQGAGGIRFGLQYQEEMLRAAGGDA
eukprot:268719-Rhodomonas_salina.3